MEVVKAPVLLPTEVKLTLQSDQESYPVKGPIALTLVLENISQKEIWTAAYAAPQCSYWVRLTDSQGKEVGVHRFISKTGNMNLPLNAQKTLRPGEKITEKWKLESLMEMPGPGRYRLRVWRFASLGYRLNNEMYVREGKAVSFERGVGSNEIEFEVR
jgi:hypothetical protein